MGKPNFSDEFKHDAVHQITVQGYSVRQVSERLGVSTHSLYQWMKKFPAKGRLNNPKRKHVRNGMLSPVDFENRQCNVNQEGV